MTSACQNYALANRHLTTASAEVKITPFSCKFTVLCREWFEHGAVIMSKVVIAFTQEAQDMKLCNQIAPVAVWLKCNNRGDSPEQSLCERNKQIIHLTLESCILKNLWHHAERRAHVQHLLHEQTPRWLTVKYCFSCLRLLLSKMKGAG